MRFYTVLASRPVYYDRSSTAAISTYQASNVAPHAATTRWTYTVPTARKAFIEGSLVHTVRSANSSVLNFVTSEIQYLPAGVGSARILITEWGNVNAAIEDNLVTSSIGLMVAGDVLQALTTDLSTGGTVNYTLAAKYTEFSA